MKRIYRPNENSQFLLDIRPETAQWKYISFSVIRLAPGEKIESSTDDNEIVIVPLAGRAQLSFNGETHVLHRKDLFRDLPDIAYLPPRTKYGIEANETFEVAIGGAPAEGKLPARFIPRDQIPTGIRGGANAKRGVSTLADSDELTERLVVYEIHTHQVATGQVFRRIGTIRGIIRLITRKLTITGSNRRTGLRFNAFILETQILTSQFPCTMEMWF
jgi:5-deoxy-D-glucuronate isomerase